MIFDPVPATEPQPIALHSGEQSQQEESEPPPATELLPQYRTASALALDYPELRAPVVHGLLREGETLNIIAPSKTGKSWLALSLAASIASGRAWLNTYAIEPGPVLIIDNELHSETIAKRVPKVIEAMGLPTETADAIYIESLRGRLVDLHRMAPYFRAIPRGTFRVIVLDALYRMIPPGVSENDNGAMALMFNAIDAHADRLGCAFVCVHHSTKGSQAEKSVVDVGSGAGSMARAADAHCVLRAHEEPGAFVLEAVARSWPPPLPQVLRWTFPIWQLAADLDPLDLRKPPKRNRTRPAAEPKPPPPEPWTVERFIEAFVADLPKPRSVIVETAIARGLTDRRARSLLKAAVDGGDAYVHRNGARTPELVGLRPQEAAP